MSRGTVARAIDVRGLRKRYGEVEAVAGIDLRVEHGEVFALLGPNGAGKTTTLEILEGYRARTAGEVSVLGFDPARGERGFRERIGIVLQDTGLERYLTAAELVSMHRGYYPSPRPLDELLDLVGLTDRAGTQVRRLSGGQRRRLDLALALAGDPDLIFLDEPTTGFDPSARRAAWDVVRNLSTLGKTILLTTHLMDEAHALASRVAVLVAGRIVADAAPSELLAASSEVRIRFRLPAEAPALPDVLAAHAASGGTDRSGRSNELRTTDPTRLLYRLTSWALDSAVELEELEVVRPSLEDVYLGLTADGTVGRAEDERGAPA